MQQTEILVVGASVSGLALAASLQKYGLDYVVIEKQSQVASPWRAHYERLHLHTNKRVSNLPFKKFDQKVPRYPSRADVISYLEEYQQLLNIHPIFNTAAKAIQKEGNYWLTETNNGTFRSKYIIMATGVYGNPKSVFLKGMETFSGSVLHSSEYKTGNVYQGKKVLVVGFGNSACEIAIDLYEQGAISSMSVRSPVNVIPRDVAGIPILELSQVMSLLPPRVADTINAPLMRLIFGDITKFGLKKKAYGAFEEISKDRNIPVLDIGTMKHIRKGNIKVYGEIDHLEGNSVYFTTGTKETFDTIVACIGFDRNNIDIIALDKPRLDDLSVCVDKQKYFGKDGLYFCGFWIGSRGHIREIALDAQKIARDISNRANSVQSA